MIRVGILANGIYFQKWFENSDHGPEILPTMDQKWSEFSDLLI